MNILPKKKWHVRTKENIARVNRDEAKAAEEERVRLERESLAEKEFRTKLLRDRASAAMGHAKLLPEPVTSDSSAPKGDVCVDSSGHVNFFADLEAQDRTFGKNKEAEKEKTRLKEEYEQKMGILKYLGEGSAEYMKDVPWYQKKPARNEVKDEKTPNSKLATPSSTEIVFPSELSDSRPAKRKREHKKQKKKRKKRRRSNTSSEEEEAGPDPALEELRKQRLKREAEESRRQRDLLRKNDPSAEKEAPKPPPTFVPRYNSQFNPEFAKQNIIK